MHALTGLTRHETLLRASEPPLWIGPVWSGSLASSRGGPSNIEFTTVCWEANGKSFVTGDQKGQVRTL